VALEIKADFTSAFCERSHAPMIGVATTIKDNPTDTLFFGALGNEFANLARQRDFTIVRDRDKRLNRGLLLALLRARKQGFGLSTGFAAFALLPFLGLRAPGGSFLGLRALASGWGGCRCHLDRRFLRLRSFLFGGRFFLCRLKVRSDVSNDEAAARVWPVVSSMTWA